MTRSQNQRTRIISCVIVCLVAIGLSACNSTIAFDSAKWKGAGSGSKGPFVRLQMADGLVASQTLVGQSKEQIHELLGEPSRVGEAAKTFGDYDLVYWLGPERSWISIDSEWIAIKLDEVGRVKEYRLTTD